MLMLIAGFAIARYPFAFDRTIILALHDSGSSWLRPAMIDITALGGGTILTIVVLVASGLMLVHRHAMTALLLVVATVSGAQGVQVLKRVFARMRPDVVDHIVQVSGNSFPSGHSADSAIVYLTLAGLATQVVRGVAVRRYIVGIAIFLVGAIGVSRVYLGVHWPSDVLAGWSFGTLWALAWWLAGAKARASLRGARR
ncbi:MAG TPA: phosphatase PAP2 family protein [Sphingomonas sp.]|jgi:undecaprenyl-diphosphatase|nr:phosphatase PAP2 family protein [Sphingomonas sp.]